MEPYYQDEWVTLFNGRCEDVLPGLSVSGDVHLVTDPPYFGVKDEAWDNQWAQASEFLGWMGEWLDLAKPLLSANASVWVFASPQLTSSVERVVGERFRVLNSVRWVKPQHRGMAAELASLRAFWPAWEGIVFAEQYADAYGEAAKALHREVFAPIGRYLQTEWERAGWKAGKVGKALGYDSALPTRWAEGNSLPTADAYERLRSLLGSGYLRREHEDLRREYEDLRRPFSLPSKELMTDVWTFKPVAAFPGKHPCEKPEPLLAHIIRTTTRPGDTIIDPFAGSGSTLRVARQLGRKAIGIEMDPKWCEHATRRLGQASFDLEGL